MSPKTKAKASAVMSVHATFKTAAHQAFELAELFESILVELPETELLFNARVCKQWKNYIDFSPRIQKKLFMSPEPITSHFQVDRTTYEISETPITNNTPAPRSDKKDSLKPDPFVVVEPNRLLLDERTTRASSGLLDCALLDCAILGDLRGPSQRVVFKLDTVKLRDREFSTFSPSWRRMYLTQPPIRKFRFDIYGLRRVDRDQVILVLNDDGLTMGDVVDAYCRFYKSTVVMDCPIGRTLHRSIHDFDGIMFAASQEELVHFRKFARFTRAVNESDRKLWLGAIFDGNAPTWQDFALYEVSPADFYEEMLKERATLNGTLRV